MDDLDHSMHIAEYDWMSFYEDSEECGLLQPSLACPDNLSLSDSEDSGNSSSVFSTGQGELQLSPSAKCDEAESTTAGCCMEEVQIKPNHAGGEQDELTTRAEEDGKRCVTSDMCIDYPEGNTIITEEVHIRAAEDITTKAEQLYVQASDGESTELKKEDGDVQTESDASSIHEPDPLSCNQAELHVNELHTADRAVSESVSSVALRAQNERWFVTVNDSPARQRVRATSVKKKRRLKNPRKNTDQMGQIPRQERSGENGFEGEITRVNDEYEGGGVTHDVTKSNQNSRGYVCAESSQRVVPDLAQISLTSGDEQNFSDKLIMAHITEAITDGNKHDPSSSGPNSLDTFKPKDPSQLDSVESDELEDAVDFLSAHSYDSESYLSAPESVEEPQPPLMENQQPLTRHSCPFRLTDADDTQDRDHSHQSTLSYGTTATNYGDHESPNVEPTLTFPSAAQNVNKMPDDTSTCNSDTRSMLLHMPSDTSELQKPEISLSASGCSAGDQLSLPTVPDVTLTPCSVADSPETYAEAVGQTRPVYAISAFWNEMEKLTINDILQLRMCRSLPPKDTHETETPHVDDFPTNCRSLVVTADSNLSDGGLMDISDTADSDYFTQPDESKPDRSSCEFSTSDFEEEYWQFLGTSRNPSPDPQSKNQRRTSDSSFSAQEEEESTNSEGKETPVPSDDFAGQRFEDQDPNTFISNKLALPGRITKSKSVRNIQALNTEDLSLQLFLSNDVDSVFPSSCPALDENMVLKANDSLETVTPAPFLSNTDILDEPTRMSFPELFENFFLENNAKRNSQYITVYDPEDILLAPGTDYSLCTFRDEISFSSLRDCQCEEKKFIPIFSCSHPTVRELTFPNPHYVFLSSHCAEDDISPIRVVSHSFIQDGDCGTSAAATCGFRSKSLLTIRKIRFHDKGSIWCRRSGAWVFPFEAEKINIKTAGQPITLLTEGSVSSTPSQLCSELVETIQTSKSELS